MKKKSGRLLLTGILGLCLLLAALQAGKIILAMNRTDYSVMPFERIQDQTSFKVLFLGDSTAVGVGSLDPRTSTAGWLSQDFPKASIESISQSGLKLAGLREKLALIKASHYDLIVIQIGANDIIRLTPLKGVDRDIRFILGSLKPKAGQIVFLHSGDIGTAPIFTWPFSWILTRRAYQVRSIYQKAAKDTNAYYVDLIGLKSDHIFNNNPQNYYAPDGLHLSAEGYRFWYMAIREKLDTAKKEIEHNEN